MEHPDYYSLVGGPLTKRMTRTKGMTVETWDPKQQAWVPADDFDSEESIFGPRQSLGSDEEAAFQQFHELSQTQ